MTGFAACLMTHSTVFIARYEYTIWPFRNATQKERHNSWNAFYGILG